MYLMHLVLAAAEPSRGVRLLDPSGMEYVKMYVQYGVQQGG